MKKYYALIAALLAMGLFLTFAPAQAGTNNGGGSNRPTNVVGTALDSAVALEWDAPRGVVTNYIIRYSDNRGRDWSLPIRTGSNDTEYTVTGLDNDTRYVFKVRSVGPDGRSDWSRQSRGVTPEAGVTPPTTPPTVPPTTPPTVPPTIPPTTPPTTPPSGEWWVPVQGERWQYQLDGTVNTNIDAAIFDVDGADTPVAKINTIHANGDHAVCYVSAGSYENWRLDANRFPDEVIGRSNGWPGENWIDVRALDDLIPIMQDRAAICKAKGFDAIEWDNVDGYTNNTGFPLTGADQLAYNEALADLTHDIGLGVGLKNDIEQLEALEPFFDFAVNEECVQYNECNEYQPFTDADKAILHVEYDTGLGFCPSTEALGFSSIVKELDLFALPIAFCP